MHGLAMTRAVHHVARDVGLRSRFCLSIGASLQTSPYSPRLWIEFSVL